MSISAASPLLSKDAEFLHSVLEDYADKDVLLVSPSRQVPTGYAWVIQRGSKRQESSGTLDQSSVGWVELMSQANTAKVFAGNRSEFEQFLRHLAVQGLGGWSRWTFVGDCRKHAASGLDDEQAWCESAFAADGCPTERTAYVVHVANTSNYFTYFNFKWKSSDVANLKSCHDLRTWSSTYVPKLYADYDVERWVFLRKQDLDAFGKATGDYRRMFVSMDYAFEAFKSGQVPQPPVRDIARPQTHRPADAGSLGGVLRSALGRLGLAGADAWTSGDQKVVERLITVLTAKPTGAIDSRKSPAALPKVKALLLKRLRLNPPGTPNRSETIELYLHLSRFYPDWDRVSCEGMFTVARGDITVEMITSCLSDKDVVDQLQSTRQQLGAELKAAGIVIGH